MAANPLLPEDFENLIPNPNGGVCDEFNKALLQFPEAFWTWYKWAYNSDGTVSTANAEAMCTALGLIGCASGGSSTSTTTSGTGTTTVSTTEPATALVWAVCGSADGTGTTPNRFIQVDLATGAPTVIKTGTSYFYGIAEDPTTGTLYGLVLNGANIDLVTVNKLTGAETVIAASVGIVNGVTGITFDSSGVLFVVDQAANTPCASNGILKTMNKASGALTTIGAYSSYFLEDICFVGSTLFAVGQQGCFSDKRLFTVNTTTGAVSTINALSPEEAAAGVTSDCLAYVNGILYRTLINGIAQINTGTGAVTEITSFDNATQGRIRGMALNQ